MPFPLTVLLLGGAFLVPRWSHGNSLDDLVLVMLLFPCLLWFNTETMIQRVVRPAFKMLAEASYAMYILHMPLLGFMAQAWNRMRHHQAPPGWAKVGFTVVVVCAAVAADYLYDRPLRSRAELQMESATKRLGPLVT